MMLAPGVSIPSNQEDIDEAFVKSSYAISTEHLKSRFSYIFSGPHAGLVANYTIVTWSKKVQRARVTKHGTEEDKAKLPPPSNYKHEHKQKRTFSSGGASDLEILRRGILGGKMESVVMWQELLMSLSSCYHFVLSFILCCHSFCVVIVI